MCPLRPAKSRYLASERAHGVWRGRASATAGTHFPLRVQSDATYGPNCVSDRSNTLRALLRSTFLDMSRCANLKVFAMPSASRELPGRGSSDTEVHDKHATTLAHRRAPSAPGLLGQQDGSSGCGARRVAVGALRVAQVRLQLLILDALYRRDTRNISPAASLAGLRMRWRTSIDGASPRRKRSSPATGPSAPSPASGFRSARAFRDRLRGGALNAITS